MHPTEWQLAFHTSNATFRYARGDCSSVHSVAHHSGTISLRMRSLRSLCHGPVAIYGCSTGDRCIATGLVNTTAVPSVTTIYIPPYYIH